jgi:hypothetical protein
MYYYGDIGPMVSDESLGRLTFIVVEWGRMGWAKLRIIRIETIIPGHEVSIIDCSDTNGETEERLESITFRGRQRVEEGVQTYLINYPLVAPGFRIALRPSEDLYPLTEDNFRSSTFYATGL